MSRAAPGWRSSARLARREVRRRPWRSALVVALVALPVGAVTFGAIFVRTTTPTAAERREWDLGQADDVVEVSAPLDESGLPMASYSDEQAVATVRGAYPPDSRFVTFGRGADAIFGSDGHLGSVTYENRPLDDPLLAGSMEVVDGRAPRRDDEVALSPPVLDRADAEIGDRVELFLLGEVTVTGVVVDPNYLDSDLAVGTTAPTSPGRALVLFADVPRGTTVPSPYVPDPAAFQQLPVSVLQQGIGWRDDELRDKQGTIFVAGGLALAGVAIVTTSAFAVGARRQLHTLGLLGASGVGPTGIRRVVLLQGATAGLLGGVVGVGLGFGVARAVYPRLNDLVSEYVDSFAVHPLDLVVPLGLGVASATAAAWLPARTASQVSVLAALAGRRSAGHLPKVVPVVGTLAVAVGLVGLSVYADNNETMGWGYALVPALAVLLGGTALAPWLVAHTEPLAQRLRGGARVAARDLARQRLRSGAVVAAVMVPAGLSVFTAANAVTGQAREQPYELFANEMDGAEVDERRRQVLLSAGLGQTATPSEADLDRVRAIVPEATEVPVEVAALSGSTDVVGAATLSISYSPLQTGGRPDTMAETRYLVVGDPAEQRRAGAPGAFVDALEAGKVVVVGERLPPDPRFMVNRDQVVDPADVVVYDLAVIRTTEIAVISPETAARWGFTRLYYGTMFRNPDPLTASEQTELEAAFATCNDDVECHDEQLRDGLLGRDPASRTRPQVLVHRAGQPSVDNSPRNQQLAVAGGSLLFTLLVVAVALALTAAESRDERALLDAIGAPPKVRRSIVAWQAGMMPALAMVLAIPGGLAVAFAMLDSPEFTEQSNDVGVQIPWLGLALLGLGVPLVSAAVTWVAAGVTGRRRRDLSTLALAGD